MVVTCEGCDWLRLGLTLGERDGDDHAVSCPHPQPVSSNQERCDAHKGEAQLASA